MAFNSFPFLLGFLSLVLCGVGVLGNWRPQWIKSWLIAASLLFYAAGALASLPLLILSVTSNFVLLQVMHGSPRSGQWAAAGVALNLVLLGYCKYLPGDSMPPLGLSFFTFTQIGCLLHHAGGDIAPPKARDYALFAAFFPTLLAGPILNPHDMLPQFARREGWRLTTDNLAVGSTFFLLGLLKKTLLADPLTGVVSAGFAAPQDLTLFGAWQAASSYSLMLYFDFSGYTDMAIGLGWMVGLRLPDNFNQPYRATSVIAYWQRWHMSLTRFLMTNIHAPMTLAILRWRKRHHYRIDARSQRRVTGFLCMIGVPTLVTMVLVSLWHGATMPFLLFGLLHTALLLINHVWRLARGPILPNLVSAGLTYLCVLIGAVFFRAETVSDATSMLAAMAVVHGIGLIEMDGQTVVAGLWLLSLYAIVWFMPTTRAWMQTEPAGRFAWKASPQWAVVMGCAATLGLLASGGTGEFLYFRF